MLTLTLAIGPSFLLIPAKVREERAGPESRSGQLRKLRLEGIGLGVLEEGQGQVNILWDGRVASFGVQYMIPYSVVMGLADKKTQPSAQVLPSQEHCQSWKTHSGTFTVLQV